MAETYPDQDARSDDIARNVRDLYEEFPYPAHGVISSVVPMMLAETVKTLQRNQGRELTYLDAGCGTGEQTLGVARAWPELKVTGLDLNRASLELAKRLARSKGINATFEHRSLVEPLSGLGPFDLITSIGVLHHLPDPAKGFRMLRGVARDHTMFMGMVYGRYGRWELFQRRDALSLIAGEDTSRSERLAILREIRIAGNAGPSYYVDTLIRRLRFGPRIKPSEAARRVLAGRNPAYQADRTPTCRKRHTPGKSSSTSSKTAGGTLWVGRRSRACQTTRLSFFGGGPCSALPRCHYASRRHCTRR